jgi:arylsulfatase A-like enzyme
MKMMHIVDWLPTLLSAAGVPDEKLPKGLDGVNMWTTFKQQPLSDSSARSEMLLAYDPIYGVSALRHGEWKVTNGTVGPTINKSVANII